MQNNWLSLLPPLLVLISAFVSKRILLSLMIGIISSSLILNNFFLAKSVISIFKETSAQLMDIQNYLFFGLIFTLGIIISLIEKTGGAQALGKIISKKSKDKKNVETSSLILSMMLFIDDYLNSLTVGNVMRSVTDKFHIPRVKLAYLVATMSAPLVIIIPISTWIGFIIGQLNNSGISLENSSKTIILTDPFYIYLSFIPFVFYSFMIIISNWIIVRKRLSFGPMAEQEKIADSTGNLFGGKQPHKAELNIEKEKQPCLTDFLLPILTFISITLIGIPYSGNYHLLGGVNSLSKAFQEANAPLILFLSSIIALILGTIYALVRKKIKFKEIPITIHHGINMMLTSVIMILFAWIFGSFLKEIQTGNYIATLLIGTIKINFIPLISFITSLLVTIAIGSTWGSIAIMVPIIVSIFPTLLNLFPPIDINNLFILIPSLGAIFSGSLAGNHLSPISDSTIMATASTGAYMIDLIQARFWYVLAPIIATALAYLTTGLLINQNIYIILAASISCGIISTFFFLKLLDHFKRDAKHFSN